MTHTWKFGTVYWLICIINKTLGKIPYQLNVSIIYMWCML